jgi:hypothetical protein
VFIKNHGIPAEEVRLNQNMLQFNTKTAADWERYNYLKNRYNYLRTSTFRAKAFCREVSSQNEGPSFETLKFCLYFLGSCISQSAAV